jgi:hypothetical protein
MTPKVMASMVSTSRLDFFSDLLIIYCASIDRSAQIPITSPFVRRVCVVVSTDVRWSVVISFPAVE